MANSLDVFIPEVWAAQALENLYQQTRMLPLVNRQFENQIAAFGDTVNAQKPARLYAKRKGKNTDVVDQDATATNVAVVMNQHIYISIMIKDRDLTLSMQDLANLYLKEQMRGVGQMIDQILLGQRTRFMSNAVGKLGTAIDESTIIAVREKMNTLLWPDDDQRYMIVTTNSEADLLSVSQFVDADKVGDDGTALRTGSIGRKYGIWHLWTQNLPNITATNGTGKTGAINNASGYAVGDTSLTVDGITGEVTTGQFIVIAGDNTPQLITGHSETSTNTTGITIWPGLVHAVADNAVITEYTGGAVNLTAGYAANWEEEIVVDGFSTLAAQAGNATFIDADTANPYTVVGNPSATGLLLDRPLGAAISNNDVISYSPPGNYNFAFHPMAITMVSRPLVTPPPLTGANVGVVNMDGIGIRVGLSYDSVAQGLRIVVDLLFGVQVLYDDLGIVVYG